MNLKQFKEHLNSLDTFGLDDEKVEVVFKTTVGNQLTFSDIGLDVKVTPKLTTTVTIKVSPQSTSSSYWDR